MSTPAPDEFREQLSAWHDGALAPEAGRFVQRRLDGDVALRAQLGRWQAIGDALRRQAQAPVSSGLASRVAQALEAEAVVFSASPRARAALPPRRRWPLIATAAASAFALVLAWPEPESPPRALAAPSPLVAQTPAPSALPASRPLPASAPTLLRPKSPPLPALIETEPPLLARTPQPTAEQLAPLPAVDAPSRPWPRSRHAAPAFTVDYSVPVPPQDGPRP